MPEPSDSAGGPSGGRPESMGELHEVAESQSASTTRRTSVASATMSSSQQQQPDAASTMQSSQISEGTPRRARPRPQDYGTSSASRPVTASATASKAQQRPGTIKRQTSSAAPHRGEKFSVDDDPDEVDEDLRKARREMKADASRARERSMRRRESTLRRRPTAPPLLALPTLDSDDAEDFAQATGSDIPSKPSVEPEAAEPSSEDTLRATEEDEEATEEEEEDIPSTNDDDDDEAGLSDAESFTLKDRQEAINETHPFGIRIWKPALYKKSRSVTRNAEGDIHSAPGGNVSRWLWIFNALWTVVFGWWLSLVAAAGGMICLVFAVFQRGDSGCREYGRVLINLAHYLFYPFGKYVRLEREEAYMEEDEGLGRDISEYERWQAGDLEEGRLFFGPSDIRRSIIGRRREEVPDLEDDETTSLLGRQQRQESESPPSTRTKSKQRLFGRGKWNLGRVIFFLSFYLLITPCLFVVSTICWFFVFSIPMGKVTLLLFYHLQRHPLALSFHTDSHYSRVNSQPRGSSDSVILLCTYRAVGLKYWKYTIDGTNIFLINLLGLVVFTIFDYFVLYETLHIDSWFTSNGLIFVLALGSIIPLAYFIGQAVASISAQSSMGVGATINAFFSTIVEVFLYCVALQEGKAQLVEGSIIGSIFAGILFLPGLSMCFGALKRKTQRFNVKSASVTSTLLLFATIALFGPTLFYQIYGSHVLNCRQCTTTHPHKSETERDCRRCYFTQVPEVNDRFFKEAIQPYIWFAAVCLFLSYVVGLLFTLRTHAAVIWNNEPDEKKEVRVEHSQSHHGSLIGSAGHLPGEGRGSAPSASIATLARQESGSLRREDIRDTQLYRRILNQSLKQVGTMVQSPSKDDINGTPKGEVQTPHMVPPKSAGDDAPPLSPSVKIPGLSPEENRLLVQQVAEIAATAAAVAARDTANRVPRRASAMTLPSTMSLPKHATANKDTKAQHGGHGLEHDHAPEISVMAASAAVPHEENAGGHDAPNWSRTKSAVILLTATIAYAVIAEILVDTVDAVLGSIDIDEKFLGITLFALVPNTTEFLNAISFAMNGNVALSMEIGSSYALQVILLQAPCLVLFSAFYGNWIDAQDRIDHMFTLIFPQWDMITVILGVFLMGWIVNEGKSNYFKGSILIFTYLVVVVGFWFSGYGNMETMGIDRFDTLAVGQVESFRTIGQSTHGRAW